MAKINETNYPRRQASEYVSTDMLIVQPVEIPDQAGSDNTRTTRVGDLKDYIIGENDPSKIGTPAAGTYTSATNTNAQNIKALDEALTNYDHLTKQIATQEQINGYISDPTTASFNVIYLLKDTSATGNDKYFEYQRLGTQESSTFEMTGDTSTDLSNYYTKSQVDTKVGNDLSNYYTKSQVDTALSDTVRIFTGTRAQWDAVVNKSYYTIVIITDDSTSTYLSIVGDTSYLSKVRVYSSAEDYTDYTDYSNIQVYTGQKVEFYHTNDSARWYSHSGTEEEALGRGVGAKFTVPSTVSGVATLSFNTSSSESHFYFNDGTTDGWMCSDSIDISVFTYD